MVNKKSNIKKQDEVEAPRTLTKPEYDAMMEDMKRSSEWMEKELQRRKMENKSN